MVAGAILAFAQWFVLRKQINHASLWIPANMLAWLVGMPIIFWSIDLAQRGSSIFQAITIMAAVLLLVGTIVGAIHGAFLVKLAP